MRNRKRRSTFGQGNKTGTTENSAALARRSYNANVNHYNELHSERRNRSASELVTMRRAAERRPGGWAAAFLAGNVKPAKERKARASKQVGG